MNWLCLMTFTFGCKREKHETQRPKRLGIWYIVLTEDEGRWLDKLVMMVCQGG